MKTAIGTRKPIVTTPGKHSLIFRGAITGVSSQKEGLQFYEVVPVALVVAGTQMATGHRTMDTHLFFEGELIDAATNKPVMKVVRKGEGKERNAGRFIYAIRKRLNQVSGLVNITIFPPRISTNPTIPLTCQT